jgi:hypothetical protein
MGGNGHNLQRNVPFVPSSITGGSRFGPISLTSRGFARILSAASPIGFQNPSRPVLPKPGCRFVENMGLAPVE